MKLYWSPLSPFAGRVRFSLLYKAIACELVRPASIGGLKSQAYLDIAPLGKIPALQLDNGKILVESDAIVEYLEDIVLRPSLRSRDPEGRAQARAIARVAELYLQPAIEGLGRSIPLSLAIPPVMLDDAERDTLLQAIAKILDHLDSMLGAGAWQRGGEHTTADGALVSFLTFARSALDCVDASGLIDARPGLAEHVWLVAESDAGRAVETDIRTAFAARRREAEEKFNLQC